MKVILIVINILLVLIFLIITISIVIIRINSFYKYRKIENKIADKLTIIALVTFPIILILSYIVMKD